ncbi:MAG: glycoside hydrolase family 32 protein [Mariniphaga sp.]
MNRCMLFYLIFLSIITLSCNTSNSTEKLFNERHRPQVHFSPAGNWMNDPNGLVFFEGEYHLFYQYYPDAKVWGPMHWGHAISTDLVHWQHLPIALYPDSLGYIFSGSAVIDYKNTSGLGKPEKPAMIAIYCYHSPVLEKAGKNNFQTQGMAFSLDKGRTWTKYSGNPIVPNPGIRDFRDPKVSWNGEINKWIMTLAAGDCVRFYSSDDLKRWSFESEFGKTFGAHGGVWECPDLIKMPVKGSNGESKWVLLVSINPGGPNGGSATQYFTGNFDGHQFTVDNEKIRWIDTGKDNYAGVTFSGIPENDGRFILIGWMSNWQYATNVPTSPWRSAMTFPRQLTLVREEGEYALISNPVEEIEQLRERKVTISQFIASKNKDLTKEVPFGLATIEIIADFSLPQSGTTSEFGFNLSNSKGENIEIGYNCQTKKFLINRMNTGNSEFSRDFKGIHYSDEAVPVKTISMHLIVDVASVELFGQSGKIVMTDIFFPNEVFNNLSVYSKGGSVECKSVTLYKLNNIWNH